MGEEKKIIPDVVSREYTINLHKRIHDTQFKKRAPRAVRAIKAFAEKAMHTKDIRLDTTVNEFVWSKGVRSVPHRIRVRLDRKVNDKEDAKEKRYTTVTLLEVPSFKGLTTKTCVE